MRDVVEFVRDASTEISPHDEDLLPELTNKLPAGTTVYVAHTPKATLEDVIRVTYYLKDMSVYDAVVATAGEAFGGIRPAATMIIAGLTTPEMKIEIEVTAKRRTA